MSQVFTPPKCPRCGLSKSSKILGTKDRYHCDACKFHFTPCEPEEKELKLAIALNERRKSFHHYIGQKEAYEHEKELISAEFQKLRDRLTRLEFAYLMSEVIMEECDKNALDLHDQLKKLQARKREEAAQKESARSHTPAKKSDSPNPRLTEDLAVKMMREMMEKALNVSK